MLTAIERGWVDDYLRLEPQYRKYEAHLKAAALGGVVGGLLVYANKREAQCTNCQETFLLEAVIPEVVE